MLLCHTVIHIFVDLRYQTKMQLSFIFIQWTNGPLTFIVKSLNQNRTRLGKHVHLTKINRNQFISSRSCQYKRTFNAEFEADTIKMYTSISEGFFKYLMNMQINWILPCNKSKVWFYKYNILKIQCILVLIYHLFC